MTDCIFKPLGYRIICKPDPIEEVTKGGIVLAVDRKLERAGQMSGHVVAVGSLAWTQFQDEEPWCKVGDHVLWARYSGATLTDPDTGENYMIMNDEDVTAKIGE